MNQSHTEHIPAFSASRLKLFDACPLKYKYAYVDRVPKDWMRIESYVGSRVHEALELLYRSLATGELLPVGAVVQEYRCLWERNWHARIRMPRQSGGRERSRRFGERCIRQYYSRHYPFAGARRTVAVEWQFRFSLDGSSRYLLQGTIDRLCVGEGEVVEVHDYKTSRSAPHHSRLAADLQPGLYQLAAHRAFPEASDVAVTWHYLALEREYRPKRSKKALALFRDELRKRIDTVLGTSDFRPRRSKQCTWCEYGDRCVEDDQGRA